MDYEARLREAMEENMRIQANLGIDSTKKELLAAKRKQYQNLLFLKEIDKDRFERLTLNFDIKFRKFEQHVEEHDGGGDTIRGRKKTSR